MSIQIDIDVKNNQGIIKITANGGILNVNNFKLDFTGTQLSFVADMPVTDYNGQSNTTTQTIDILRYADPLYCNYKLLDDLRRSIWWDCENILMTSNLNCDNLIRREIGGVEVKESSSCTL